MNIEFPCPKSVHEMQRTDKGFYCDDCNQSVLDLSKLTPEQLKNRNANGENSCIINYSDAPSAEDSRVSIRKFALAAMIVFGVGLFTFSNAQMAKQITSIKDSTSVCPIEPSKIVVSIQNRKDQAIWGSVKAIMPNGKELKFEEHIYGVYFIELPAYAIGKEIEIVVARRNKTKSESVVIANMGDVIDLDYVFNGKQAIRRYRLIGCPNF